MNFALKKCAVIHLNKDKVTHSPIVKDIPLMTDEDSYRYLGILECDDILYGQVKTEV